MNVYTVSLRRKFNLGNYESIDVEVTSIVGPDENAKDILTELKGLINEWVGSNVRRGEKI